MYTEKWVKEVEIKNWGYEIWSEIQNFYFI